MAVSSPDAASEHAQALPKPGPHVLVLFGATGDLARRKLIPGPLPPRAGRADARRLPHRRRLAGRARRRGLPRPRPRRAGRVLPHGGRRRQLEDVQRAAQLRPVQGRCAGRRRRECGGGDRRRAAPPVLPLGPAVRRGPDRAHARRGRAVRARPRRDGEAVRDGPGLGPRAQRDGPRGVRRGPDLQDRPLPGQGSGPEHAGPAVRQRLPRAAVEPRAHRPRADRRARDARRSARAASSTRGRARSAT